MTAPATYYDVLGVPRTASPEAIRSAYRARARENHPDHAGDSPESVARFILATGAWEVLGEPERKKEYDEFLAGSAVLRGGGVPGAGQAAIDYRSPGELLGHLNFLLWEIEDFITGHAGVYLDTVHGGVSLRDHVLDMLMFIDRWVLTPAGYPDYFLAARRMKSVDPVTYLSRVGFREGYAGHRPFTGITDYFYDIRRRMDRFLGGAGVDALAREIVPGTGVRVMDAVVEAQNHTIHYLRYLGRLVDGSVDVLPPFVHGRPLFGEKPGPW